MSQRDTEDILNALRTLTNHVVGAAIVIAVAAWAIFWCVLYTAVKR